MFLKEFYFVFRWCQLLINQTFCSLIMSKNPKIKFFLLNCMENKKIGQFFKESIFFRVLTAKQSDFLYFSYVWKSKKSFKIKKKLIPNFKFGVVGTPEELFVNLEWKFKNSTCDKFFWASQINNYSILLLYISKAEKKLNNIID